MSKNRDIASSLGAMPADATNLGTEANVFRINSQTVTSNHTIDSADNAVSAGPITVDSGVTITINGNWTVV